MRYIICPCSSNHKSTCLTWYIPRITLDSINLWKFTVNPFSTCFWVCLLTGFYANSFSAMDSAFQTDSHTWFSSLHIGLYRHLTHQEIHTEPTEMTCEGFVVFLTGSCCPTRKLWSISNGIRGLFSQSWIAPLLPWSRNCGDLQFQSTLLKMQDHGLWKQYAFWCLTKLSNRYRYASCIVTLLLFSNSQACSLDLNPHQPENKRPEMGPKGKRFSKELMTQMFTRWHVTTPVHYHLWIHAVWMHIQFQNSSQKLQLTSVNYEEIFSFIVLNLWVINNLMPNDIKP